MAFVYYRQARKLDEQYHAQQQQLAAVNRSRGGSGSRNRTPQPVYDDLDAALQRPSPRYGAGEGRSGGGGGGGRASQLSPRYAFDGPAHVVRKHVLSSFPKSTIVAFRTLRLGSCCYQGPKGRTIRTLLIMSVCFPDNYGAQEAGNLQR